MAKAPRGVDDLQNVFFKIMKFLAALLILFSCLILVVANAHGQRKTIILVRHAEKDTSETADPGDPVLTSQGVERANRLAKQIKRYKIGAVYSTDYKRTRDTAAPIANRRNLKIEIYDPKKPNELVDAIVKSKIKRFLIVGHSNTIPQLANLLVKKEIFKSLDDAEHSVIWVIKIRKGRVSRTEIFDY